MTKKQFELNIILVIGCVSVLLAIAGVGYFLNLRLYLFIKEMSSFILALPAAYLTYCIQRRQVFLASLRELWKEANDAKGVLIQYTHLQDPNTQDFSKAHFAISKTIDSVRSVYKNVGEDSENIGFFPFECLHDMRRALESVYPQRALPIAQSPPEASPNMMAAARAEMIGAWNAFRWRLLPEFQAPAPSHAITERGVRDIRRKPTKPG